MFGKKPCVKQRVVTYKAPFTYSGCHSINFYLPMRMRARKSSRFMETNEDYCIFNGVLYVVFILARSKFY